MKFIPAILIVVLVTLAAPHAWWGVGGRWPGHDERSLVELVIGRARSMPGPVACMLVASALFATAGLVALHGKVIPVDFGVQGERFVQTAFWIACAVFALRGLAGFIPPIFAHTVRDAQPSVPFAFVPSHRCRLCRYASVSEVHDAKESKNLVVDSR